MTPDVNILVAASRSDHPHHAVALGWCRQALADCETGATFRIMPFVLTSFLRLVTHSRIFRQPTPVSDAIAFVDAVLAVPGVELCSVGDEWPTLRSLCLDRQPSANSLPDAWLVAAVMQHGEHLVSFDKGLKRLLKRESLTILKPS